MLSVVGNTKGRENQSLIGTNKYLLKAYLIHFEEFVLQLNDVLELIPI